MSIPDAMHLFLAVWLFVVGSCVGSFLNVVVFRLPAGVNLSRSGSRCPVCLHPIRMRDNVPILGWLLLAGRCRDCRTPISARYPVVEVLIASLFLFLAWVEGFSSGANLPGEPVRGDRGISALWVWSVYTTHVVLLSTLIAGALIEHDGHRVPGRMYAAPLVAAFAAPLLLPSIRPLRALLEWNGSGSVAGLIDGLAGGTVGLLMAGAAWCSAGIWVSRGNRHVLFAAGLAVGLVLGWQATVEVLVVAAVFATLLSLGHRVWGIARVPYQAIVPACILALLILWGRLVERWPGLGQDAGWPLLATGIASVAGLALMCRALYRDSDEWVEQPREIITTMDDRPQPRLDAILSSPSYVLAEEDLAFLKRPELRPVRVQLELLKPELLFQEQGISSTIVVFGGTQILESGPAAERVEQLRRASKDDPGNADLARALRRAERIQAKSHYYDMAREFGRIVSKACQSHGHCDYVVVTGGGPGIMEAANRGATDVGAKSIGLNITLPEEQAPNPYITPELCLQFHYFSMRKMHFLFRAKALVVFPGGYGTLDELFDALTLRQTGRMQEIPIVMVGRDYWNRVIDFEFLADEGVIADEHLALIRYVETAAEAWEVVDRFHATRTAEDM